MAESTELEDVETGKKSKHCRYFKMKVLDTHKSKEIVDAVKDNIENKSIVFSDKSKSYVDICDYVEIHSMEKSTVFMSSRTQAVRLPKAVALPADVKIVDVIAVGRTRIISPAGESWDSWFSGLGVTNDFMSVREQPEPQERESF